MDEWWSGVWDIGEWGMEEWIMEGWWYGVCGSEGMVVRGMGVWYHGDWWYGGMNVWRNGCLGEWVSEVENNKTCIVCYV